MLFVNIHKSYEAGCSIILNDVRKRTTNIISKQIEGFNFAFIDKLCVYATIINKLESYLDAN